jgi:hypothetical protein
LPAGPSRVCRKGEENNTKLFSACCIQMIRPEQTILQTWTFPKVCPERWKLSSVCES